MVPPDRLRKLGLFAIPWSWFVIRNVSAWMEVVAVAIPVLGAGALIAAALLATLSRLPSLRVILVSTAVVAAVAAIVPRLPLVAAASRPDLTIVSANLTGDNPQAAVDVEQALGAEPDLLILLEVNDVAARRFDSIERELPYSIVAPALGESRVALFSRSPLLRLEPPPGIDSARIIAARVETADPFIVVAAHLPRPWWVGSPTQARPGDRQDLVVELGEWLSTLGNPIVLAGDLNSTDRGLGYRTLIGRADLVDAMRVGWASSTSTKWWPLLLRIDHVLVRGICPVSASTLPLAGSDHRGVIARLERCV